MTTLNTIATRAALSSFSSAEDFANLDRATLRSLVRAAGIVVTDRKVMDRSSDMRALLAGALAEIQAEDARIAAEEAARIEAERQAEIAAAAPVVEESPVVEKAPKGSKWSAIVANLWNLREEGAVEVRITAETLLAMGLPTSATKHPAYWHQNPPGRAAREMGLTSSLRKEGEGRVLVLSLTGAGEE